MAGGVGGGHDNLSIPSTTPSSTSTSGPSDSHQDKRSLPPSTTTSTTTSPSRPSLSIIANGSVKSQPLMADLDLLISFDDDHDMVNQGGLGGGLGGVGGVDKEGSRSGTFPLLDHQSYPKPPPPHPPSTTTVVSPPQAHPRILSIHDPLVGVERDVTHFDVLPRLPLTKVCTRRHSPLQHPPPSIPPPLQYPL